MAIVIVVILLRYRPNALYVLMGAGLFRFVLALVWWRFASISQRSSAARFAIQDSETDSPPR